MVDFDVMEASTAPIGSFGSLSGNNITICYADELSLLRCLRGVLIGHVPIPMWFSQLHSLLFSGAASEIVDNQQIAAPPSGAPPCGAPPSHAGSYDIL